MLWSWLLRTRESCYCSRYDVVMTLVRSGNKFKHSSRLDLAVAFGRFVILGNFGYHTTLIAVKVFM